MFILVVGRCVLWTARWDGIVSALRAWAPGHEIPVRDAVGIPAREDFDRGVRAGFLLARCLV